MNKKILSAFALISLVGIIPGVSDAKLTPFDYSTAGVEILDFDLDFKAIEIMLDVKTNNLPASIEITFERDFFDSTSFGQDDKFTIIADGNLVYYEEIITTSELRTLKFNLSSDTELVEIFGTQLKGITAQSPIIEAPVVSTTQVDNTDEINKLEQENQMLREENNILNKENRELDGRIFELQNLVSALEVQVTNLNTIIIEQVKVIYNWVLGYSVN